MSEERLNEIIENINTHNILQSCSGGMTSYDCMISELAEYALDLQQRIDKAIKYIKNNQSSIAEPSGIMQKTYGKILSEGNIEDLLSILKGK